MQHYQHLELSGEEIHGIRERAVERGLERRQAEKMPALGVDECKTSPLQVVNGKIKVPTGPGFGADIDPEWVKKHQVVKL